MSTKNEKPTAEAPEQVPAAPSTVSKDAAASMAPALLDYFSDRYLIDRSMIMQVLMNTAFRPRKGDPQPTLSQMMMLMVVAKQYGLNPFTREIYAFPSNGGIVPIVGVDGWVRIIRERPELNGIEFNYGPLVEEVQGPVKPHEWVECVIYRKDNEKPTIVREYYNECFRPTEPWKAMPKRMLRHKALIQASRYGFGFAGIYDEDEAATIIETTHRVANNAAADDFPSGRVHHRKQLPATAGEATPIKTTVPAASQQPVQEVVTDDGEVLPPQAAQQGIGEDEEIRRDEVIESIENAIGDPGSSAHRLEESRRLLMKNAGLIGPERHAALLEALHKRLNAPSQLF